MKQLSKADLAARDALSNALKAAAEEAATAYAEYANALNAYNEALDKAREWRDRVVEDIELYRSNRSDQWLQSEAGEAHQEWMSEYENIDLEDLHVPDELDLEHGDLIDDLPNAPM